MATKRKSPTKKTAPGRARATKRPAAKKRAATRKAKPAKKSAGKAKSTKRPTKRPTRKAVRKAATGRGASAKRAVVPAFGPVSLEEARALVRMPATKATARGFAPTAVSSAADAAAQAQAALKAIGEARRQASAVQGAGIRGGLDEYAKVMALLDERGVRGLEPVEGAGVVLGTRSGGISGGAPLRILAEGDSWFHYPACFSRGGVIPRLEERLGVPIASLAKAGDEVRYMLGVEERKVLAKRLREGSPAGGKWELLLFSGGGNDIVDNPMALWILDYEEREKPEDHIHPTRFATALDLVRAGYEDLIALRDALSPETFLLFHAYDFAIPDGRKIFTYGPWLQPTFRLRNFPEGEIRTQVVRAMLVKFREMLLKLVDPAKRIALVETQGTLPPTKDSWHNELHPSEKGFDLIVEKFRNKIRELFPGRVL